MVWAFYARSSHVKGKAKPLRIDGKLPGEKGFQEIEAQTAACVERLRDPNRVRMLVNAPELGHSKAEARRAMAQSLKRPNLYCLAVYGANPIGRVMFRFLAIAAGVNNARGFATEAEAVTWLLS